MSSSDSLAAWYVPLVSVEGLNGEPGRTLHLGVSAEVPCTAKGRTQSGAAGSGHSLI